MVKLGQFIVSHQCPLPWRHAASTVLSPSKAMTRPLFNDRTATGLRSVYRIALNFRGSKFSQIAIFEDFVETFSQTVENSRNSQN